MFIACPMLEEKYRDVIRIIELTRRVSVHFIHLSSDAVMGIEGVESEAKQTDFLETARKRQHHTHVLISAGDNRTDFDTAKRMIGDVLVRNR